MTGEFNPVWMLVGYIVLTVLENSLSRIAKFEYDSNERFVLERVAVIF
jgi:hypothetical protein